MSSVAWPSPWRMRGLELRIDVDREDARLEDELDVLQRRLARPGDALHGIACEPLALPGFRLHWREADGELYVYVEDVLRRRLAGCTVFNRLIELDARADRHLRSPHSRYRAAYRRRGLASAVYRRSLDAGMCLLTGVRQSGGAHALWRRLGADYPLHGVHLRDRVLRCLGDDLDAALHDDLYTRLMLLGRGWTLERLAAEAGLVPAEG
ncbi:N-acetyltransferase [Rubrivivax gelatinosus]|nr:N-acetyltransferase [Rubrivivax gelatinosus]